ncbi:MAG: GDSL-type esterase/lipase family protein [Verrucomicrobia bacterium]|nr:GDSL-type esterase/lipase family protein [Verrucomicrobiota bacterium]
MASLFADRWDGLLSAEQINRAQQRFEASILSFEADAKSTNYPADSIVFAGSSTIRLWQTLQEDMAPLNVIQRGFGGSDSASLLWYAERIFAPLNYRAVVFFSANDIMGRDTDATPEAALARVVEIVAIARKDQPYMPVIWIAVTPTPARWHVWPQAKELNKQLESLALKIPNFHFINTESYFLNEHGQPRDELFVDDQLHLNTEGYRIFSALVRARLEAILP